MCNYVWHIFKVITGRKICNLSYSSNKKQLTMKKNVYNCKKALRLRSGFSAMSLFHVQVKTHESVSLVAWLLLLLLSRFSRV